MTTDRSEIPIKLMIGILLAFVVFLVVVCSTTPTHHRHYKHTVIKLKHGKYAFKDSKNRWWLYTLTNVVEAMAEADTNFPQPWVSSSGSVRLPAGGNWTPLSGPPSEEEIEGELEVSIEETIEGPEIDSPDTATDSDSNGDVGDSGGDGDGGGGDGGGCD